MGKKCYMVTCQLNMCADKEVKVLVWSTKPHIAMREAEGECYRKGYFHAKAVNCEECGPSSKES